MTDRNESNELLIGAWSRFSENFPTGTVERRDGVAMTLANVLLPFLNICHLERAPGNGDELRDQLRVGVDAGQTGGNPWMFSVCADWLPEGWEQVAEEEGLEVSMSLTGMAADALLPPRRPLPELEIRRVDDEKTARDIAELNAHAYEMPLEMVECMCNMYLWGDDAFGYVGYVDGDPVSCSATFPVAGTVYVALVATHPDHQRKGYAEAVMRRSIEEGQNALGLTRTTLHASEAGRPLYEAMGYDVGPRFYLLTEPLE